MFADDIVLIAKADIKKAQTIINSLESFSKESSLKINMEKSTILFPRNVLAPLKQEIKHVTAPPYQHISVV